MHDSFLSELRNKKLSVYFVSESFRIQKSSEIWSLLIKRSSSLL
ncbi:hypothetical protein LEP1GSC047_3913 [Leptospira inadai serovar Lyme str. 10]|uniref:Uncharacterized protein n=1 Tax=Leptospira inadai serovar Lyme str. 10 TaxID=1049790 RepID=V6HC66_9LEPT|nr:hypothetical protein LEP1GSC047_3913 [Leptospira inadai serovar Lyme str. 10]